MKFEAECQEFAKFLRSLEQFIQTVKGQNNLFDFALKWKSLRSIDCRPWNTTQNIWGFIWIVCVFQSLYDIRKYLAFMYKPWLILNSIYCQLCIWNHDKDLMSLNGHEKANEPENESFAYLWCYVQLVHIPATVKAWHSSVVNFSDSVFNPFWSFRFWLHT